MKREKTERESSGREGRDLGLDKELAWLQGDAEGLGKDPRRWLAAAIGFWSSFDDPIDVFWRLWTAERLPGWSADRYVRSKLEAVELPLWGTYFVDVDGTVYGEGGRPIDDTAQHVKLLLELGVPVVFLTAREETLREETERWLRRFIGPAGWELVMKPVGERRDDAEWKADVIAGWDVREFPIVFLDDLEENREAVHRKLLGQVLVASGI